MNKILNAAKQFRMYEENHRAKARGASNDKLADTCNSKADANGEQATQLEALMQALEGIHGVAMDPGNAHANHYLRGMANGIELMMATLEQREPNYIQTDVVAPDNGFDRVKHFHQAFSLPINEPGYVPTVEERLLRGRLFLEEAVEHLCAGLGLHIVISDPESGAEELVYAATPCCTTVIELQHLEGFNYDPVETLDGLADAKVILNGTGVAFGLPVPAADTMVYESNMSKLDENGQPIINGTTPGYTENGQDGLHEPGYRPDLPHGKVLKPAHYVAPDIASLLK